MSDSTRLLPFASDYMDGCHPAVLQKLIAANMDRTPGYGLDPYCEDAKNRIRRVCGCPDAEVEFLVGGTQTNATVIDALLRSYEGVIAVSSGHIAVHESGAIEAGGHKVLPIDGKQGKLDAAALRKYMHDFTKDDNRDHEVQPGMVYLSQPTEYGTLYTLNELSEIKKACNEFSLRLYVDGARLAYALACPENDVTLTDLAALCDVFYIGGTKCGALCGEAVVIPDPALIPHFFTIIKQHGALLAKGRLLGIQFGAMFTDDLYYTIGRTAITSAAAIRGALRENNYSFYMENPTNQILVIFPNDRLELLGSRVAYSYMEKYDDTHTVIRFCTGWSTTEEDTNALCRLLREFAK